MKLSGPQSEFWTEQCHCSLGVCTRGLGQLSLREKCRKSKIEMALPTKVAVKNLNEDKLISIGHQDFLKFYNDVIGFMSK